MSVLERAIERAKEMQLRVVLPEREDARIAEAAERIARDGLGVPVDLVEPSEAHVAAVRRVRPGKDAIAKRLVEKPLVRAAAMVAAGEADVMVAGAVAPTRRVIEAASLAIGLAPGISTASSFFLMRFPDSREMIWADCAATVAPDAEALADIALASAQSAAALLGRADVAMLSYSTGSSGGGASVDLVRKAADLATARGAPVIGPLQGDAALNRGVAAKKGVKAGDANVLVFPSLDAGNIAYKLAQELAGAQAIGPFLQGFAAPVCDLSRGATVDDIAAAVAVTAAMA
ncbi:MAG: phosphate acyltransferase [Pseudomonadota bacterium]